MHFVDRRVSFNYCSKKSISRGIKLIAFDKQDKSEKTDSPLFFVSFEKSGNLSAVVTFYEY